MKTWPCSIHSPEARTRRNNSGSALDTEPVSTTAGSCTRASSSDWRAAFSSPRLTCQRASDSVSAINAAAPSVGQSPGVKP